MDSLPDPILSPSKAAQAASLSLAWSEITHFLTPLFHPHPIPVFERNPATLNALRQLFTYSSVQTDRNALLFRSRAFALQELQSALPTADESDSTSSITTDPSLPILLSIASSLPLEAQSALRTLSTLPVVLDSISPATPLSMAISLTHLTRAESETAQQLARVESLHQQLKSEYALAQELLDKLRGESGSTGSSSRESSGPGGESGRAPFQTPSGLVTKTGDWGRGTKQASAKIDEYRERTRRLEKSGNGKGGIAGGTTLPELRVEERELRDLEARVRGLEGRVRGYEGLPPDKELALLEVERMRRELEGLVRKRDGIFEGLVERRD